MNKETNDVLERLAERKAELETALERLIEACDKGRQVEKGVGGMTIQSQLKRTFINGVSAWVVEEAREVLASKEGLMHQLSFVVSNETRQLMDELKKAFATVSDADMIRRSLDLLQTAVELRREDGTITIIGRDEKPIYLHID